MYMTQLINICLSTVFPRLVPAGIINLVFLADADTKQGRIVFEEAIIAVAYIQNRHVAIYNNRQQYYTIHIL